MYGIFTYIWLILMVNVSEYTSHMVPMGIPSYDLNPRQHVESEKKRAQGSFW